MYNYTYKICQILRSKEIINRVELVESMCEESHSFKKKVNLPAAIFNRSSPCVRQKVLLVLNLETPVFDKPTISSRNSAIVSSVSSLRSWH
jgi:hypothetical protein